MIRRIPSVHASEATPPAGEVFRLQPCQFVRRLNRQTFTLLWDFKEAYRITLAGGVFSTRI